MKSALTALPVAALLLVQVPALGQSNVQVYGILDAGIEYVDHGGESGKGMARVISSGKNTSRWGMRGSEDLGGGMKALFNLEGEVELDTGGTDGPLFKRQANVGLAGRFGQVIVGRSFTTTYDFVSKFDPMGYAPNYSWAVSGNASGLSKYGMTTGFDNLVKYTGQNGGLDYGATIGLGEQAGNSRDNRKVAVGTSWHGNGLGLMATYERINGATVPAATARNRTQAWHLGISYSTGPWKYAAAMRGYRFDAAAGAAGDRKADTYWFGVTRQAGATTLTGAVYHIDTNNAVPADADPTMVVLRAMHSLSKQTTLYAALAHAKAANGLPVSLSRDDAGVRDTQTGLTAGMQYRF